MNKQHIPTALPSDTELLNALEAAKSEGTYWVCRKTPMGIQALHETTASEIAMWGYANYTTVREALAVGLGLLQKET